MDIILIVNPAFGNNKQEALLTTNQEIVFNVYNFNKSSNVYTISPRTAVKKTSNVTVAIEEYFID